MDFNIRKETGANSTVIGIVCCVLFLLIQSHHTFAQIAEGLNYGTFENVGDEVAFKEYYYQHEDGFEERNVINYAGRSTLHPRTGAYSLLVNMESNTTHLYLPFSKTSVLGNINPSKNYFVSAWVYVPAENVGFDVSNGIGNIYHQFQRDNQYVFAIGCGGTAPEAMPGSGWHQVYAFFGSSEQIRFDLEFLIYADIPNATVSVFIDDIELHEVKPVEENAKIVTKSNGLSDITLSPTGGAPGLPFIYQWSDAPVSTNTRTNLPAGEYSVSISQPNGCETWIPKFKVGQDVIIPLCEVIIPPISGGNIKLDKASGLVVLQRGGPDCPQDVPLGCIQGRVDQPQLLNVVAASATTYANQWSYDYLSTRSDNGNAVERGEVGKWRPLATYSPNKSGLSNDKNYNSGRYTLSHFTWQYPQVNHKLGWVKESEITKYSPNGEAVEERDALKIASTAKFGYHDNIPYLVAKNAAYNDVLYESFENVYKDKFLEDGTPIAKSGVVKSEAHTGSYSYRLKQEPFKTRTFLQSSVLESKGILIRLWAKGMDADNASLNAQVLEKDQSTELASKKFMRRARAGEWSLWEARIAPGSFSIGEGVTGFVVAISTSSTSEVWIDDVRIQPTDAAMTCYVYDPRTLRVLATFDDQHFALLYQYNSEGQLVRKMVETERGVKTIQETQYNQPKVNKMSGE